MAEAEVSPTCDLAPRRAVLADGRLFLDDERGPLELEVGADMVNSEAGRGMVW